MNDLVDQNNRHYGIVYMRQSRKCDGSHEKLQTDQETNPNLTSSSALTSPDDPNVEDDNVSVSSVREIDAEEASPHGGQSTLCILHEVQ